MRTDRCAKWMGGSTLPRDYRRFRACAGKVKHPTRQAAEAIAERQTKKWKLSDSVKLVAYYCDFCRQFHTGRHYE
jgi:hypothetical protein